MNQSLVTRYGIATQTQPHGTADCRCRRPARVFLTGPEFLPQLHDQCFRTLTLVDKAETDGHARVAQMSKRVLANSTR